MPFYINPRKFQNIRRSNILEKLISNLKILIWEILTRPLLWLGFVNINFYYLHGNRSGNLLTLGNNVSTSNAIFNIASGNIIVGSNTIFGHNVSVITGYHKFYKGKLSSLNFSVKEFEEVPKSGNDIKIGEGCFLGSNCIVLKNVSIGNHSIVAAGSVVTKSFPEHSILAGVPATQIGSTLST